MVRYSSFWSKRSKNQLNLNLVVSNFVPRDLEAQHRTSRDAGGTSMHSNIRPQRAAVLLCFEIPDFPHVVHIVCYHNCRAVLAPFIRWIIFS